MSLFSNITYGTFTKLTHVLYRKYRRGMNWALALATIHEYQFPLPHYCGLGELRSDASVSNQLSSIRAAFTSVLEALGRPMRSSTRRSVQQFANSLRHFMTFHIRYAITKQPYQLAVNFDVRNTFCP
jgi:hypothetical protein